MITARTSFPGSICAALLATTLAATPAIARPPTQQEKLSLAERIEAYLSAYRQRDFETVVSLMLPALISHDFNVAKANGEDIFRTMPDADEELFRKSLAIELHKSMEGIRLVSASMDTAKIEYSELNDGTPFGLIPTMVVMDIEARGGKFVSKTFTLAHLEGNAWYLSRVDDLPAVANLQLLYPAYSGVEFPRGSIEAMKE